MVRHRLEGSAVHGASWRKRCRHEHVFGVKQRPGRREDRGGRGDGGGRAGSAAAAFSRPLFCAAAGGRAASAGGRWRQQAAGPAPAALAAARSDRQNKDSTNCPFIDYACCLFLKRKPKMMHSPASCSRKRRCVYQAAAARRRFSRCKAGQLGQPRTDPYQL